MIQTKNMFTSGLIGVGQDLCLGTVELVHLKQMKVHLFSVNLKTHELYIIINIILLVESVDDCHLEICQVSSPTC